MTIQRIDNPKRFTHGWQARATTIGKHYLSRFFADKLHGGPDAARERAIEAERELVRQAKRLKR